MKHLYVAVLLFLSSCSLAPEAFIPTSDVPANWRTQTGDAKAAPTRWEDFGSSELNELITKSLANNTDMQASLARIEQARASTVIAASGLYPAISASGSASQRRSYQTSGNFQDDSAQLGLDISYELDVFARNKNQAQSARYRLDAVRFDREVLAIALSAEVARLYTGLLATKARVALAEKNLESFRDVLRITDARYDSGSASGLEQAQQRSAVSSAEASLASTINQRELFLNQLALLTGTTPTELTIQANDLDGLIIPPIALAAPWSLLARRPDIARAEADLRAANIDIGIARANALPSVQLGLNASTAFSPSSQAVGLVASFFAPIFQGGALQADIERSVALRDEQLANYKGVLLASFREVEDALSNFSAAESRSASLMRAAQEARRAYSITRAQYDAGSVDFQTLLDTQRSQLQADDAQAAAQQVHFAAAIDLMRALGGSFTVEPTAEPVLPEVSWPDFG